MPDIIFFGGSTDEDKQFHPFWMGWAAIIPGSWDSGNFRQQWNDIKKKEVSHTGAVSNEGAKKLWKLIQQHEDRIEIWGADMSWRGGQTDVLTPAKRKEIFEQFRLGGQNTTLTPEGYILPVSNLRIQDWKAYVDITHHAERGGLVQIRRDVGDNATEEEIWERQFVGAGYDNPYSRNDPDFKIEEVQLLEMDKPTLDAHIAKGDDKITEHIKGQAPYLFDAWIKSHVVYQLFGPLINWTFTSSLTAEHYAPILKKLLKAGVVPRELQPPEGWAVGETLSESDEP